MGTRGRKSKTDLAIVSTDVTERPGPPVSLGVEQKSEWMRIVNSYPADYFGPAQVSYLKQYVKHSVEADHVTQMITELTAGETLDLDDYERLLKMQERETRCLASLAVRLGFAKTAHREQGAKNPTRKPWE